jgi:FkbM family methyltransferase|tara:strand:+ start:101 stop:850 length:750 start_codon:yes stop_codon:yes gene_type:complete
MGRYSRHAPIAFVSFTLLAFLLSLSNSRVVEPNRQQSDLNGLTRDGSKYGGWWYDSREVREGAVIYSFGLGEDTSWDEALIRRGASVYGFDPTPKSAAYVEARRALKVGPGNFYHTKEGLWTEDTTLQFTLPDNPEHVSVRAGEHDTSQGTISLKVNTLSNFLAANGHSKIDILKMDVEGAEYGVLEQLLSTNCFPFEQLLVEFHHRFFESGKEKQDLLLLKMLNSGFAISRNENNQEISFRKVYKREM